VTGYDCTAAVTPASGGVYLNVHAQPGARREAICGMHGDALKIAVRKAPEAGRANAAIIELLARELGLSREQLEVTAGQTSRRKRLFIRGDADRIAGRLAGLLRDV
jgi:uncharacterized protein